ncbi:ubiquinone biosynthesis accessory factor UbiJ [Marinospirillum perlucidum]|uniref:ubiquinone biosynthesis accessory factor UbiJ n=1 Tax=Marinospirillum perlucidum TaxID=1982602 RepID=UPI000DF41A36|nr:SCP2 sterol-binding domain-containing protein [Marinospirillum perlucidum]
MQLPLAALTALESLINPLLRQAAAQGGATALSLQELSGSLFELRVHPQGWQVFVQVSDSGLYFYRQTEETADAWMEASLPAYLQMATRPDAQAVLFSPEVKVGGQTAKLEAFQGLLAALGLDAGELLNQVAGPLPLAGFQAGLSQLLGWTQRTANAARQDFKDYLEEETGVMPGENSRHLLEDSLDELRMDVDRLEARIRLLETAQQQAGDH